MNILQAMDDPAVFAPAFKDQSTWAPWRALLSALFGLPMTPDQLDLYRKATGRDTPPPIPPTEAWLVIGRRGGKSFVMALIAVFLASFRDWRPYLAPGEVPTIMIIAQDRRAARIILGYVRALINGCPMLAATVVREGPESIELRNRVCVSVHTCSFRSTRGFTVVAALLDEVAIWRTDDSANPDEEVIAAIKPAMATIPGAMLIAASSPYARKGALWNAHKRHHGRPSPVLCWQAPTRWMNPTVSEAHVEAELAADPARARAEYLAEFRSDVESFISMDTVERLIEPGIVERAPIPGVIYTAFVDPSGGSSDSFTLAIGHRDGDLSVLDAIRERRPPFSPEQVVAEFCELLKRYNVYKVSGDRYAGLWPSEQFAKRNITYEPASRSASDLYRDALPLLNSQTAELLDHPVLVAQLCSLERRTSRVGRDAITHPPHGHDDVANAVAGVLTSLVSTSNYGMLSDAVLERGAHARQHPSYWDQYALAMMRQRQGGWT
jgi:hypothetical protein